MVFDVGSITRSGVAELPPLDAVFEADAAVAEPPCETWRSVRVASAPPPLPGSVVWHVTTWFL